MPSGEAQQPAQAVVFKPSASGPCVSLFRQLRGNLDARVPSHKVGDLFIGQRLGHKRHLLIPAFTGTKGFELFVEINDTLTRNVRHMRLPGDAIDTVARRAPFGVRLARYRIAGGGRVAQSNDGRQTENQIS